MTTSFWFETLGSSRRIENFLELDQVASSCQMLNEIYLERMGAVNVEPSLQNHILVENFTSLSGNLKHVDSHADHSISSSSYFQGTSVTSRERDNAGFGVSDGSAPVPDQHAPGKSNFLEVPSIMHEAGVVGQSFQDGHCKTLEHHGSNALTEVVTDDVDSSSSHHEREQPEEDGENGEMLGGMFAFSEEGRNLKL